MPVASRLGLQRLQHRRRQSRAIVRGFPEARRERVAPMKRRAANAGERAEGIRPNARLRRRAVRRRHSLRERGRDAVLLEESRGVASASGLVPRALEFRGGLGAHAGTLAERRLGIRAVKRLEHPGAEMRDEFTRGDLSDAGKDAPGEVA